MTTYILVECEDDNELDNFLEFLRPHTVGVFKKPTKFCDCESSRKPPQGWTKGTKYGWWICTMCGKPSERWAESLRDTLGRNLLDNEH